MTHAIGTRGRPTHFTASARAVAWRLFHHGEATRPQLCEALGLSRPTMSLSIGELERAGYIDKVGEVQGATGRRAASYRLGRGAGHVISVDAGSTHVHLRVVTLDRRLLHNRVFRLASSHRRLSPEISMVVAEEVAAAQAATLDSWGPLRALGIALPARVVDNDTKPEESREFLFRHFAPPANAPVILENNVNCAALAEQRYGIAEGRETFAYVQVGYKIGMGVLVGGRLLRGQSGAAGEIGHLPFPWGPEASPAPGEIEIYLGADALMGRVRKAWRVDGDATGPPENSAALLALAASGDRQATAQIKAYGQAIGAVVAACVAVIDPGLVVMGGGIGGNPLLTPYIDETVNRLSYPTRIEASELGPYATTLGVESLATEHAIRSLLEAPDS